MPRPTFSPLLGEARVIPVLAIDRLEDAVPLARALYASVEIDEEIPVEHYQAVAEVIGYVLRLKRRRA